MQSATNLFLERQQFDLGALFEAYAADRFLALLMRSRTNEESLKSMTSQTTEHFDTQEWRKLCLLS